MAANSTPVEKYCGVSHDTFFTSISVKFIYTKKSIMLKKLDVSVYHVNTQEGSPSHFSNKSYTLIIFFADNQFVHVIIK